MSIMVAIFDFRSTQKILILLRTIQGRFQPSVIPHYLVFLCELSFLQEDILDFHYYKFTIHYRFMNIINKCKYFKKKPETHHYINVISTMLCKVKANNFSIWVQFLLQKREVMVSVR